MIQRTKLYSQLTVADSIHPLIGWVSGAILNMLQSIIIASLVVMAIFPHNDASNHECTNDGVQDGGTCLCRAGFYGETCENGNYAWLIKLLYE